MKILLTGSTGFVGSALKSKLADYDLIEIVRKEPLDKSTNFYIKEMSSKEDFSECLKGIDVVIHMAAKVHQMNNKDNEKDDYLEINHKATVNLALQAANAGVKRFIFISTIKVNGEKTEHNKIYTYLDKPNPEDSYAISKAKAEKGLLEVSNNTNLEVVIIRPPLIYGPAAKGNFLTLMKISKKNIPLPFKSIKNKRSFVSIDNLVDLIEVCIKHPNAKNNIFLVSDGLAVSTSKLIRLIRVAYGLKPNLFYINPFIIKIIARMFRKEDMVNRLYDDLHVDIKHTKNNLDWYPPVTMKKVIKDCIDHEHKKSFNKYTKG